MKKLLVFLFCLIPTISLADLNKMLLEEVKPCASLPDAKITQCVTDVKYKIAHTWYYEEDKDEMRGTVNKTAFKLSSSIMNETNSTDLVANMVLKHIEGKTFVAFTGAKCLRQECDVLYKFDDQEIQKTKATSLHGNLIITNEEGKSFSENIKKSKQVIVEYPTNKGIIQFKFFLEGFDDSRL